MKNKGKERKYLWILGIICLVIVIAGATFAYFSALASNNNKVVGTLGDATGISVAVTKITNTGNNLIPVNFLDNTNANNPASGNADQFALALGTTRGAKCQDSNGNNVCQVYQITVRNNSANVAVEVEGKLTLTGNATNMYWQKLSSANATTRASGAVSYIKGTEGTLTSSEMLQGNGTATYYVVVWLEETGSPQESSDANKSFGGRVSFNAIDKNGNSSGVTAIFNRDLPTEHPTLATGMIPVTIANDGTVTAVSSTDASWYDYDNQEWANAVLTTSTNRSTYQNIADGLAPSATIPSGEILAYYVWIPRYSYQIWTTGESSTGNEQVINIKFVDTNTKETGSTVNSWLTHPAFTFGNQELSGIWVGKFETTGTSSAPTILPNANSLDTQNVSSQFITSLIFAGGTLSNGNVTFAGNGTYGLTASTDTHMMKNSEWGAVAYLSHSNYGQGNNEIRINNYINYNSGTKTGCGASTANASATNTCGITYGAASQYPQSTTGNISGIFDMNGGRDEYVMGVYLDDGVPMSGDTYSNNSGFNGPTGRDYNTGGGSNGYGEEIYKYQIMPLNTGYYYSNGIDFPPNKYYDGYSTSVPVTACNGGPCYGHALSETKGWHSDYDYFVYSDSPWFDRGGNFGLGSSAGAFCSYSSDGFANHAAYGFRVVAVS